MERSYVMKKLHIWLLVVWGWLLVSCSQGTYHEQHEQYLLSKGWHIKGASETETITLDLPEELLHNFEASGVSYLREHIGETATQYHYKLQEKDAEGERLGATIHEVDGEIIGGYGTLPSWTPGVFNLDDQKRLMDEQMIKQ